MMPVLVMLLQAASLPEADTFDLAIIDSADAGRRCSTQTGEVVVCGRRNDRYRLPLPTVRDDTTTAYREGTGMAALTPAAPCGIFAGQRRCGKAEASAYGYGDGRDPITLLTQLGRAAVGASGE